MEDPITNFDPPLDNQPTLVITTDSAEKSEDTSPVTDTSEEDSAQVMTLKITPGASSDDEDTRVGIGGGEGLEVPQSPQNNLKGLRSKSTDNLMDIESVVEVLAEGKTQSMRYKKIRTTKGLDLLAPMSARERRGSSRDLSLELKEETTPTSHHSSLTISITTVPDQPIKRPRAHDILLLSSLLLGAPDWDTWTNCSPLQMWYYIPLFLRVLHRKEPFPEIFYSAIKPMFYHPDDQSIRHLIYWMSRCDMLPPESAQFFGRPDPDQEETCRFFESLGTKKLKANDTFINITMCDPVFGVPSPLVELTIVKLFKAHTRPALCDVRYKDPIYPNRRFIYKKGDDLRDDMYTQVMFFVFNKIWENSGIPIKPFIHMYRVFPTGKDTGFVEFVPSTTIQAYDWNNLDRFSDVMKKEFICSAAGAFAGAFILGIRDRHRDNMMISDKGHFFHIDFGYMFNNRTWFDANRFAIPTEIRTKLPTMWDGFLELIGEAYRLLRRNRGMITYFVTKLFGGMSKPQGVKKFKEPQIIKCLTGAFYDQLLEQEAVLHIRDLASKGEASPKKALKDLVHNFESKQKK